MSLEINKRMWKECGQNNKNNKQAGQTPATQEAQ